MRKIVSGALANVARQLGMPGQAGQHTDFLEDELQQAFVVNDSARRAQADIGASGYFYGILQNVHAAAGSEGTTIDPYNVGAVNAANGWPGTIPNDWDLWLMGFYVHRSVAGGQTMTQGFFSVGGGNTRNQGFGLDDAGAPVVGGYIPIFENFVEADLVAWNASVIKKYSLRWPRGGTSLSFNSTTAGVGATTLRGVSMWGLFPAGMGQDIAQWG